MTCRAFDGSGHGDMLAVVRCMDYSLRMGAHVTLNSYGSRMPALPVLQHAISQMQVLLLCSAPLLCAEACLRFSVLATLPSQCYAAQSSGQPCRRAGR